MNDGIYAPSSPERLAAFNAGVHRLIAQVRAAGADLILSSSCFRPRAHRRETGDAHGRTHGQQTPASTTTYSRNLPGRPAKPGAGPHRDRPARGHEVAARRTGQLHLHLQPGHPSTILASLIARTVPAAGTQSARVHVEAELARIQADTLCARGGRRALRSETGCPLSDTRGGAQVRLRQGR
jgi:hypothetical protein